VGVGLGGLGVFGGGGQLGGYTQPHEARADLWGGCKCRLAAVRRVGLNSDSVVVGGRIFAFIRRHA
jgi:hypothetical protein